MNIGDVNVTEIKFPNVYWIALKQLFLLLKKLTGMEGNDRTKWENLIKTVDQSANHRYRFVPEHTVRSSTCTLKLTVTVLEFLVADSFKIPLFVCILSSTGWNMFLVWLKKCLSILFKVTIKLVSFHKSWIKKYHLNYFFIDNLTFVIMCRCELYLSKLVNHHIVSGSRYQQMSDYQ